MQTQKATERLSHITAAFGLGPAQTIQLLGGTATPKWAIATSAGRFVVRIRPPEFSAPDKVAFAHTVLNRLADAGLPVPRALACTSGTTTMMLDGHTFEVLSWVEGQPWATDAPAALENLGSFLARFHQITTELIAPHTVPIRREDHPDALQDCLVRLQALPSSSEQSHQLASIRNLLQHGRQELEAELYPRLPRAVIHGDFHPGNVRFRDSEVAALYDFDYLAVQARVRDLVDAMMFFASTRPDAFVPDSIRSLTQPFMPDTVMSRALFAGYQSVLPLTADEWRAVPLLLRSRWIQMRLRGSRKVPSPEQLKFALDGFDDVIEWLDGPGQSFFAQLYRDER